MNRIVDRCRLSLTRRVRFAACWPIAVALLSVLGGVSATYGQPSWEYSPYDLRVWVAFGSAPELSPSIRESFPVQLDEEAWAQVGAPWKLTIETAPQQIYDSILTVLGGIEADQISAVDEKLLEADKVIMVAVDYVDGSFVASAREFDCRTLVLGRVAERRESDPTMVAATALRAILGTFAPIVRVETSKGKEALIRVRAGGLVVSDENPVAIKRNSLLQPVIRKNDRYGKPKRIDVVEWTYLRVDHPENNLWICEVQSAMRNPLTGRSGARTLKIGLGVRPEGDETQLQLVSLDKTRRDGKEVTVQVPMEGYEVFAKSPIVDEEGKAANAIPLGRTDWRGMITVKRDPDYPLRLIYVKNGRFLLARLPLIPGLDQTTLADLTSDDQRLEIEAFVRGIEANVMDIVARRQIMASRIRRRLASGKGDEAQKLMEELIQLPGKDKLEQSIATRKNAVKSRDPREQRRITAMLDGVRILLSRFLDDGLEVKLREELRQAGVITAAENQSAAGSSTGRANEGATGSPAAKKGGKKKAGKKSGKKGKKRSSGKKGS